jgi:hypothetical protein
VGGKRTEELMNKWVGGYEQDVLYMFPLQVDVITKAGACARKLNILFHTAEQLQ